MSSCLAPSGITLAATRVAAVMAAILAFSSLGRRPRPSSWAVPAGFVVGAIALSLMLTDGNCTFSSPVAADDGRAHRHRLHVAAVGEYRLDQLLILVSPIGFGLVPHRGRFHIGADRTRRVDSSPLAHLSAWLLLRSRSTTANPFPASASACSRHLRKRRNKPSPP